MKRFAVFAGANGDQNRGLDGLIASFDTREEAEYRAGKCRGQGYDWWLVEDTEEYE